MELYSQTLMELPTVLIWIAIGVSLQTHNWNLSSLILTRKFAAIQYLYMMVNHRPLR